MLCRLRLKSLSTKQIYHGKRYSTNEAQKFKQAATMHLRSKYQNWTIPAGELTVFYLFYLFPDKHLLFQQVKMLGGDVLVSCHL